MRRTPRPSLVQPSQTWPRLGWNGTWPLQQPRGILITKKIFDSLLHYFRLLPRNIGHTLIVYFKLLPTLNFYKLLQDPMQSIKPFITGVNSLSAAALSLSAQLNPAAITARNYAHILRDVRTRKFKCCHSVRNVRPQAGRISLP